MQSWLATSRRSRNLGSIGMIAAPKCHTWPSQKLQRGRIQMDDFPCLINCTPTKFHSTIAIRYPFHPCKCFPFLAGYSIRATAVVKASGDGVSQTNTPVIKELTSYIMNSHGRPITHYLWGLLEVYFLHHVFLDPFNRSSKDPRWSDPSG